MEILPEAEHFVGTRGGGMDHAAIVASRAGCALHLHFSPLKFRHIRIPEDWRFLVAHSRSMAEKSGAPSEKYNRLKEAGLRSFAARGYASFLDVEPDAIENGAHTRSDEAVLAHVVSETDRVGTRRRSLARAQSGSVRAIAARLP